MNTWNGYRASNIAGGGLRNGYATPKSKQEWAIGNIVNVGFVKNLLITDHVDGEYLLTQQGTGRKYAFAPHQGIWVV